MRIIRVFPRRTNATPSDDLVRVNCYPGLFDEADEIHISVCFTYDLQRSEKLAKAWSVVAPVKIGGPAIGERSGSFVPGMYIKKGYVITSRGCPNHCWFCSVPEREGNIREIPITDGWNILDDNILACSDAHLSNVFLMLSKQKQPIQFTGGLEAKRLKPWHSRAIKELKTKQVFFAYDTPDDLEPLRQAGSIMFEAGFTRESHCLRCHVLCGYKGDTFNKAEKRMWETIDAGFMPSAMLYRDRDGKRDINWMRFQREWQRPALISTKIRTRGINETRILDINNTERAGKAKVCKNGQVCKDL